MGRNYWDHYYYEPSEPKEVKNGIKAKSKRGAIGETWWSKRWIGVLESFDMGARLGRGRSYARRGQVVSIDVKKGVVISKVQGTLSEPYNVKIKLNPISKEDWEKVIDAMASKAIFAAKLLSGQMPQDIEDVFLKVKVSLFPKNKKDLKTECSCPDLANPCKHIAAVYYLLAERFDEDPFLIFKLRGKTKEEIIDALRTRRTLTLDESEEGDYKDEADGVDENVKPLEECLNSFWVAGDKLYSFSFNPSPPEVENAILKRLGDSPFFIGKNNLTSLLSKAYEVAGRAALERLSLESEGDTIDS